MAFSNGIIIKNLLLIETSRYGYRDQYMRPWNVSFTRGIDNAIREQKLRSGSFAAPGIAAIAASAIQLSSNTECMATIASGWDTQRYRFILNLEHSVSDNRMFDIYCQGYSAYSDHTISGDVNDDLPFHINTVIVQEYISMAGRGWQPINEPKRFNIIPDDVGPHNVSSMDSNLRVIRPSDIADMLELYTYTGGDDGDSDIAKVTTDSCIGITPISSGLQNNTAAGYFSKILDGNQKASAFNIGYSNADTYGMLSKMAADPNLTEVAFLAILAKYCSGGNTTGTYFTLEILHDIDPNFGGRQFKLATAGSHEIDMVNAQAINELNNCIHSDDADILASNDSEDMLQPRIETLVASSLAFGIAGHAVEHLLQFVSIAIDTLNIEYPVIVTTATSMVANLPDYIQIDTLNRLAIQIKECLLPTVTKNGAIHIQALVLFDITGETRISINVLNGEYSEPVLFIIPSFANGRYSPIIGSSETLEHTSRAMHGVLDALNAPYEATYVQHSETPYGGTTRGRHDTETPARRGFSASDTAMYKF